MIERTTMRFRSRLVALLGVLALGAMAPPARADEGAATEEDPTVIAARKEFVEGTRLVHAQQWGEALAAFERASSLKEHAITTFNIAHCQRAMGQYTLARRTFLTALAQDEASNKTALTDTVRVEGGALLRELEGVLPKITITLRPADASIAVDGRPLERTEATTAAGTPVFVAGTLPPGPGASPSVVTFQTIANPGAHVFTVSRQGYQDVVVNRTLAPGSESALNLELDKLPATIHVTSNLADALVRVNDADVGNAPVDVSRVAGRYHVAVSRKGFVTVESDMTIRPGERVELAANLREEKRALTQQWWFWTGIGVVVAGAAAGTYALTRSEPDPTRPPTDGGGLGWSLRVH